MDGLRQRMTLPEPAAGDPAKFPEKYKRLPATLEEAIAEFEKNEVVKSGLGDSLTAAVLAVRKFEAGHYRNVGSLAFKEMLILRH
eukprot:TRINITY_DN14538_c0_g4_i1.p2 TRINITY_DN14538_c0_g4~~TRINITY_DN14538_c0_g4_i1.p2  ORF type:complete len:100 (-),score=22.09 TRINITY_DN14538_c0_g4_i1:52-306(-)